MHPLMIAEWWQSYEAAVKVAAAAAAASPQSSLSLAKYTIFTEQAVVEQNKTAVMLIVCIPCTSPLPPFSSVHFDGLLPLWGKKSVNYFTNTAGVASRPATCGKSIRLQYDEKEKKWSFPACLFLFLSPFLFPASVAPPYVKDPPSALPPFSFSFLSLCSFALCSLSPSPSLSLSLFPPLPSPCTLWYADMQEFLGLKMIDQTCQPWLLFLKMATLAVCVPVIGACLSYSSCDWS